MATSPEAKAMRQRDRDYRDTEHGRTLASEQARKDREPLKGNQPAPGSQK